MASIRKRKKKDGSISYYAEIVIKRNGEILHREGRTFLKLILAKTWAAKRELELQQQDVFSAPKKLIISELINEYLDNFETGRTKRFDLLKLAKSELAKKNIYRLNSSDIIKHCIERNKTAKPQTVKNDVIWLKAVLTTMKGVHSYNYSLDMFESASTVMRKEGLVARPDERNRRPTKQELWRISREYYRKKTPYLHMLWFSIYSTRRISEICKLKWDDINHEHRTILVRDMKTPGKKVLNIRAKIPKSAYKIIMRQPKIDCRIFPYNPRTVSDMFSKTCMRIGIDDLHLHDMRHEAVSRLFENGLNIADVSQVSLHQSWASLKIYTNLKPEDVDV